MSEMIVQVRNKMLRRIGGVNHFVSHNKDYTIQFQFDESWDNVRTKMAVFAYEDGEYGSEIFDGDTCNVPELPREGRILIGVKAGEDLSTELLCIPVCKSADDVITDEYDEPDPKIYEQILDIINNLWNGGTTVYPSPVKFLESPSTAKVGDLIRVKEVDENGDVTRTEGFDVGAELEKKINAPQTAAVGEVLTVEEVNAEGKPIKWKTQTVETAPPDWDENDSTKPGYVKNRPFYKKFQKQTFVTGEDNNLITFEGREFKAGDLVEITVDGKKILLTAQDAMIDDPFESVAYSFIGDSLEQLYGQSGTYGWTFYCVGDVTRIQCFSEHTFECEAALYKKMPLEFSPITISSYGRSESGAYYSSPVEINEVLFDESFFTSDIYSIRGTIIQNEDYSHVALKITGQDRKNKAVSYEYIDNGVLVITNTNVGQPSKFVIKKDSSEFIKMKSFLSTGSDLVGKLLFVRAFEVNGHRYYTNLILSDNFMTGMFITKETYLFSVVVDFNTTEVSTRFNQDWTMIIKRIL